jgi:hypothetical protein
MHPAISQLLGSRVAFEDGTLDGGPSDLDHNLRGWTPGPAADARDVSAVRSSANARALTSRSSAGQIVHHVADESRRPYK